MPNSDTDVTLNVSLGRLDLTGPILVASGTFGYAREMEPFVDMSSLGGIVPKTITREPRSGNPPPRTVETTGGMLNSIGLDNDGLDQFIKVKLPYLASLPTAMIVSIAGRSKEDFVEMAAQLGDAEGVDALELNLSCPNVSGGVDFGTDPLMCGEVVAGVRAACDLPILVKLTPNVANVPEIARAAADAGCDAVALINTCLGMAIDWRSRRPILGNKLGGLSGPAIKPIALRIVYQVAAAVDVPIVGIGGIATIDDVMEFLVAGASAVQIGTANFYDPSVSQRLAEQLPAALSEAGVSSVNEIVGTVER